SASLDRSARRRAGVCCRFPAKNSESSGREIMTDTILRGGTVIDGSGAKRFRGDVAIAGDRIAAVGSVAKTAGAREIDVSGLVVVTGNCGVSLAPLTLDRAPPPPLDLIGDRGDYAYPRFADYLAALDRAPAALNAACLVGHSSLRVGAMAALDRPAAAGEIAAMQAALQEALDAGAIGLSSGLYYAPAAHAPPAELEALAALLRPAGALYTTHMRDEGAHVLDSLDESFAVGRAAGVPVVISHHKTTGTANFGRTAETLPKIAAAMAGQEVGLDVYPYIASSTVLRTERLGDALKVLITWSKPMPEQAGRE